MAISKSLPDESITHLINKGGAVVNEPKGKNEASKEVKLKSMQLKLPAVLMEEIDKLCWDSEYQVRKPRHSWIVEAILEKVNRSKHS
ncbi:MAG: hypothetical protein MI674_07380 [Cytophagales bacterium]|nr:hypothetical protein [Cytophagales bacterium]